MYSNISIKYTDFLVIYLLVILCFRIGGFEKVVSIKITTLLKKIDLLNSKENASDHL